MKLVASRQVLEAARRQPAAVARVLADLERRRAPAPGEALAEVLEDGQFLGVEGLADRVALRYVAAPPSVSPHALPPLASLPRRELLLLGVPPTAIAPLQRLHDLAGIAALGLPREVAARVRFRALQLMLPRPEAADRLAVDGAHLERYLKGELTDLMLHLDPTQERIVELDGAGTIVVRGVAGSGKTAVALHRVHRLLRQRSLLGGPRLLFLTFNRALAAAARQLVAALGLERDDLEITTLHRFARELCPAGRLIDGNTRRGLLAQAQAEASGGMATDHRRDLPFLDQELTLIKTRVTGGLDEYLALRRHGAVRPLDARGRAFLWRVREIYDRLCAEQGVLDFDELIRRAHQHLIALGERAPRYDHVLCDEAQDFPLVGLRLAALLARPPGHVFLAYDPAQSLYQRGFRWKDGGLLVRGARSIDLSRNFRNTREILDAARPLLSADSNADPEVDAALVPEPATRPGPPVARLRAGRGEEISALVADLRARIAEGQPTGSVAVLAPRNQDLITLQTALGRADIPTLRHGPDSEIRLRDPRVKVLTFHSAKGLEFPVVYVLASTAALTAAAGPDDDQPHLRRLLYVAMTRAVHTLVLVTTAGAEPAFLMPPPLAR